MAQLERFDWGSLVIEIRRNNFGTLCSESFGSSTAFHFVDDGADFSVVIYKKSTHDGAALAACGGCSVVLVILWWFLSG